MKEFNKLWNIENIPICRDLEEIKKHRKKHLLKRKTEFLERIALEASEDDCEFCKRCILTTISY